MIEILFCFVINNRNKARYLQHKWSKVVCLKIQQNLRWDSKTLILSCQSFVAKWFKLRELISLAFTFVALLNSIAPNLPCRGGGSPPAGVRCLCTHYWGNPSHGTHDKPLLDLKNQLIKLNRNHKQHPQITISAADSRTTSARPDATCHRGDYWTAPDNLQQQRQGRWDDGGGDNNSTVEYISKYPYEIIRTSNW
jgi:hypothetical protein